MYMGKIGQKSAAFINHKPFHPGSYRNLEKVWIAEQQHQAELKKQQQLLDKRQQESKVEELRRALHEGTFNAGGSLSQTSDIEGLPKLEWMYRSANQLELDEQEAYLLGEKELPSQRNEEVERIKHVGGGKSAGATLLGDGKNNAYTNKEDMLRKMREDPMFIIKQAELEFKKQSQSDPLVRAQELRRQLEESRRKLTRVEEDDTQKSKRRESDPTKELYRVKRSRSYLDEEEEEKKSSPVESAEGTRFAHPTSKQRRPYKHSSDSDVSEEVTYSAGSTSKRRRVYDSPRRRRSLESEKCDGGRRHFDGARRRLGDIRGRHDTWDRRDDRRGDNMRRHDDEVHDEEVRKHQDGFGRRDFAPRNRSQRHEWEAVSGEKNIQERHVQRSGDRYGRRYDDEENDYQRDRHLGRKDGEGRRQDDQYLAIEEFERARRREIEREFRLEVRKGRRNQI